MHYIKFKPATLPLPTWTEYRRASELDASGGDNPDFAVSTDKVHVDYTSFNQPKNRDRLSNNNWNNPEDVPYYQYPLTNQVKGIKPLIVGNTLNVIYESQWSGWSSSGAYIGHTYRDVNGITWYQNPTTFQTDWLNFYDLYPYVSTNTSDGKIHIIYWDKGLGYYAHKYITGTVVSGVIAQVPISVQSSNLIGSSNDLYAAYIYNPDLPGAIKFRHYDAAPLAPQNFNATNSGSPYYHPILNWTVVNEPDVRENTTSGILVERRKYNSQTHIWSAWSQISDTTGVATSWVDQSIVNAAGGGTGKVQYRIRSKDVNNHTSPYSTIIEVIYGTSPAKINLNTVKEFKVNQNYPNPFNPSTVISYSIPFEGSVRVRVFNTLGEIVSELVNQTQTAGEYQTTFDAGNLASGMYFYSIEAVSSDGSQNLKEVKKMLLQK